MRALFTSVPATGHVNSALPLAAALRAAGHGVAFCCAPQFEERLTGLGFRHFAGGGASLDEFLPAGRRAFERNRARFMRLEVFGRLAPERLMPDLEAAVENWRPDVLLRESSEFAACLLAERLRLPHVAVATGSDSTLEAVRRIYAPALDALRRRHGLAPERDGAMMHRYLTFSFMPPAWDGRGKVPRTLHHLRYEPPPVTVEEVADWLPHGAERPLVLAALGTLMYGEPGLFEAIIEAVGDLPVDAIAAIGRNVDPARFGAVASNVRLAPHVPQPALLAHADVFVTHGGFNSTKEALSQGVPLVVVPIGAEQPHTARRVEALGLGLAVWPEERSPATIRRRVREVLEDGRYRAAAVEFAAEIRRLPPAAHAVTLVQRLVDDPRPMLRNGRNLD